MKKLLCLLLVMVMMLSLLTACKKDDLPQGTGEITDNSDPNAPDLTGRVIKILTEETWVSGVSLSDVLPRFKQIEERTGCTIVWETIAGGSDYSTVIQTRLTGDPEDCPDIVMMGSGTSQLAKYIEDDLLYDYTKAFDVCPNIKRFWEERSDLRGIFTYSDGGIYNLLGDTFSTIDGQAQYRAEVGDNAIWYRADIAAELGWDTYPTTMDELHDLLLAVKQKYPDMVPLHMWNWDGWESVRVFTSAYGLHFNNEQSGSFFYADENGKVVFEPATDACKEWLKEMNKWYEEGLVVLGASEDQKIGAAAQGRTFAGFYGGVIEMCEAQLKEVDPDAYFLYMPFPTADGYELTYMGRSEYSNSFVIIDNGSEEQCRAAAQFLDYTYMSDYGIASELCGVQGEGWDFDDNGNIVINQEWLGKILKGELVLESTGAHVHFNGPSLNKVEFNLAYEAAEEEYKKNNPDYVPPMSAEQEANWKEINAFNTSHYCTYYPAFYMTDEDLATMNALSNDLYTFTNEMISKFIMGTESLDNFQTKFVDRLYSRMNLEQILELQQKYYDIYLENASK